jgi:hypothetical protein
LEYGVVEFGFSAFEYLEFCGFWFGQWLLVPAVTGKNLKYVLRGLFTLIYTFLCLKNWEKTFRQTEKHLAEKGFGMPIYKQNSSLNDRSVCLGRLTVLFLAGCFLRAEMF